MHQDVSATLSEREVRMYRGSFALIIFAEAVAFVTVFASRFLYTGTDTPLELGVLSLAIAAVLWAGWFLARGGLSALRRGELGRSAAAQGWGALLAWVAVLLLIVDLRTVGLAPSGLFASHYYLAEAMHLLHALAGALALTALWSKTRRNGLAAGNAWVLEAGVLFWGFVAWVWIAFLLVFFVI